MQSNLTIDKGKAETVLFNPLLPNVPQRERLVKILLLIL